MTRQHASAICAGLVFSLLCVTARASAQVGSQTVSGTIVDAATSLPVPGVSVRAGKLEQITGKDGRFSFGPLDRAAVLTIERMGYRPREIAASDIASTIQLVPEPVLLDAVAVQRSRSQALAVGTALTVQTIGADAIEDGTHTSLAEALTGAEGVAVSRMGLWGSRPSLRGLDGERVAILIDGSRVNRACAFGMDQGLSAIDPNTVERVEILSGPGSALYGSGNIGGVINVVTRRSNFGLPVSGEVRGEASSAVPGGSMGGTLNLQSGRADAALSFDGASYQDYQTPKSTVANSSFRHGTGSLRVGYDLGSSGRLSFQSQIYEGRDIGWPSMSGAEIPAQSRRNFALDYGAQIGHGLIDAIAGHAFVQRLDHDMVVSMTSAGMGGKTMTSVTQQRSHSTTSGGRGQVSLHPSMHFHSDVGAELTQWAGENNRWVTKNGQPTALNFRTWPGTDIRDAGAFAQNELHLFSKLIASAGVRADYVTRAADGKPTTDEWIGTGNAGLRLRLPASLELHTSVGWGYRLPDPTELFGLALRPDGFIYTGNTDLRTERSRNLEAGISRDGDVVFASATAFRNALRDLISPVLVPGDTIAGQPVRTYENLSEARITGITSALRFKATSQLQLAGTLSYTHGIDTRSHAVLPRIAPLSGVATARYLTRPSGHTWLELEGEGATRQTRVAAGEARTPSYAVVNARMRLELGSARLNVGVDNILDRAYRAHLDPVRLLRPGRNVYVRVTHAFGASVGR